MEIKPLQKWNVSKGNNFQSMFRGCSASLNIKELKKWKIPKNKYKSLF